MSGLIYRLFLSVVFTGVFLVVVMPFFYILLLGISYRLLEKIEMWNECVKESESFFKGLKYFMCVLIGGIGLVLFTMLLRLFEKLDVFRMLEGTEDEECV